MGLHLLDNLDFGRLAATCRRRARWEILFVVGPLRAPHATRSPVNLVAIL
jgi:hypothetical protein